MEPAGTQRRICPIKRIKRIKPKWDTTRCSDPRFLTRQRPG